MLGVLAALTLLGGLVAPEYGAEAARRRKRANHGRHVSAEKKRKRTVDCGSCTCDSPCDACFICNETTRVCEPDPDKVDEPCGDPGQVCQAGGDCSCDDSSCRNPTPLCYGESCEACLYDEECQDFGLGDVCCGGS